MHSAQHNASLWNQYGRFSCLFCVVCYAIFEFRDCEVFHRDEWVRYEMDTELYEYYWYSCVISKLCLANRLSQRLANNNIRKLLLCNFTWYAHGICLTKTTRFFFFFYREEWVWIRVAGCSQAPSVGDLKEYTKKKKTIYNIKRKKEKCKYFLFTLCHLETGYCYSWTSINTANCINI